jgi:hypothetical protein
MMPMLAFINWFRGNSELRLWTGMMRKSFIAMNT